MFVLLLLNTDLATSFCNEFDLAVAVFHAAAVEIFYADGSWWNNQHLYHPNCHTPNRPCINFYFLFVQSLPIFQPTNPLLAGALLEVFFNWLFLSWLFTASSSYSSVLILPLPSLTVCRILVLFWRLDEQNILFSCCLEWMRWGAWWEDSEGTSNLSWDLDVLLDSELASLSSWWTLFAAAAYSSAVASLLISLKWPAVIEEDTEERFKGWCRGQKGRKSWWLHWCWHAGVCNSSTCFSHQLKAGVCRDIGFLFCFQPSQYSCTP